LRKGTETPICPWGLFSHLPFKRLEHHIPGDLGVVAVQSFSRIGVRKVGIMRTTITIDDDLLAAAKALARSQSVSVGAVISELARKGLSSSARTRRKNNFPVFSVPSAARPITLEDVKRIEDEP
jgi:predicted DNA-binding ribbon-helix-helix protein